MAGFREFVTGEVLTAANVDDFLAKQAVMKFADAAARDSALGTAVAGGNALREGMVAYLDDTNEVIKYDGTDWSSVAPAIAGIGSNVVSTTKTDTFTASIATGAFSGDVTGLTATITPSTNTSKILVSVSVNVGADGGSAASYVTLFRDGSATSFRGDAAGSRQRVSSSSVSALARNEVQSFTFLDSPETTSAVTYSIRLSHQRTSGSTSMYVNRSDVDGDANSNARAASSITAIEVAA
jgi:hypothetical protein